MRRHGIDRSSQTATVEPASEAATLQDTHGHKYMLKSLVKRLLFAVAAVTGLKQRSDELIYVFKRSLWLLCGKNIARWEGDERKSRESTGVVPKASA